MTELGLKQLNVDSLRNLVLQKARQIGYYKNDEIVEETEFVDWINTINTKDPLIACYEYLEAKIEAALSSNVNEDRLMHHLSAFGKAQQDSMKKVLQGITSRFESLLNSQPSQLQQTTSTSQPQTSSTTASANTTTSNGLLSEAERDLLRLAIDSLRPASISQTVQPPAALQPATQTQFMKYEPPKLTSQFNFHGKPDECIRRWMNHVKLNLRTCRIPNAEHVRVAIA